MKAFSLTINNHRYTLSEQYPHAYPGALFARGHGLMKSGARVNGVTIDTPREEIAVALRVLIDVSIEHKRAAGAWVQENIERFLPSV